MPEKIQALLLDSRDSVATVLADTEKDTLVILKGTPREVSAADTIPYGHKIAVKSLAQGEAILKYGQKIGRATQAIGIGEWVHLHNMSSDFDLSFSERIDTCSKQQ